MIFPWNRREIYVGNSLQEFNRILDILAIEKIKYDWKKGGVLYISDSMGNPQNGLHYIYVHKKDLDKAQFLIRKR
jgi:hypothetical protein